MRILLEFEVLAPWNHVPITIILGEGYSDTIPEEGFWTIQSRDCSLLETEQMRGLMKYLSSEADKINKGSRTSYTSTGRAVALRGRWKEIIHEGEKAYKCISGYSKGLILIRIASGTDTPDESDDEDSSDEPTDTCSL